MMNTKALETRTLAALNRIPVPVLALRADTMHVALANDRFREVFGYIASDLSDANGWWEKAIPDHARRRSVSREFSQKVQDVLEGARASGPMETLVRADQGLDLPVRMRLGMDDGFVILTLEEAGAPPDSGPGEAGMPLVDPLTGLANKDAFLDGVEQGLSQACRHGQPFFLVAAAVADLAAIEAAHGADALDGLIRHYAGLARQTLRRSDTAGRLEPGEFAFMLPQTHRSGAMRLVERLRQAVQTQGFTHKGEPVYYTVDYAVTGIPGEALWSAPTRDQFMQGASQALKRAMREKRVMTAAE